MIRYMKLIISIYVILQGTSFLIWDVGGQDKIRPLWRSYTRCTDGIVFVVDSVDGERLDEARCELHKTARQAENLQVILKNMCTISHANIYADIVI